MKNPKPKKGRKKSRASGASGTSSIPLAVGASADMDLMDAGYLQGQFMGGNDNGAEEMAMSEESEDDELPVLPRQ